MVHLPSALGGGQSAPEQSIPHPPHPGQGGHCMRPVSWVARWKFLEGWTNVWSSERHTDELVGARRYSGSAFSAS
jgi:hypothetical protein